MEVENKIAIVTGASSGIGRATAVALSQKGAKVVLAARSIKKLNQLAKDLSGSMAVRADMTKPEEIKQMIKKTKKQYGRIDILVNNAGQGYDAPVEKVKIDILKKIITLDLFGPLITMQEVIPIMRKQKEGAIINISSGTALMYLPNMAPYSSIKRALADISLIARQELKRDGIKVTVVYPYITDTDFEKNTINEADNSLWKEVSNRRDRNELPPADSAEFVAEKILEVIKTGKQEIFAHDFMKMRR